MTVGIAREALSTFDVYVERRLDQWGREFRLHEELKLGHQSKNMLAVLIEHKGEMPKREAGFGLDVSVPPLEWQIERIIQGIHRDAAHLAAVLRAYYGGRGRQGVERCEQAAILLGRPLKRQQYFAFHIQGFHRVAGILSADDQARVIAR